MLNETLISKKYIIYDSNCLMCQGFLYELDNLFHNKNLNLYVSSNPIKLIKFNKNISFDTFLKKNLNYLEEICDNTIIYLEENKNHIKYTAIIQILKDSDHKFIKPIAIILNLIIPKFIGDIIYNAIAKNRKKLSFIFGKDKCKLHFKNLIII